MSNLLEDYDVISTKHFKLKDKVGRIFQIIDLKKHFGVKPDIISVEKVWGENNKFLVRGFIKKEKKNDNNSNDSK